MIVVGLISGTSVDAIDIAAADLSWRDDAILMRPLGHLEHAWPAPLRERLLRLLPPAPTAIGVVCALDVLAGRGRRWPARSMDSGSRAAPCGGRR
jgi:anhydro-N-acetylmuramic acid kinase